MKSTSGGIVMVGSHLIKSWSAIQKSITLSSAEAELTAAIKMTAELICVAQFAFYWNTLLRVLSSCVNIIRSGVSAISRRRDHLLDFPRLLFSVYN